MAAYSSRISAVKSESVSDTASESAYVAVVDDDRSVGVALCRLLRTAGVEAKAFESAADFLRSLQEREPDCLVLDVQMPGMNGLELQQRLKDLAVMLPVIM